MSLYVWSYIFSNVTKHLSRQTYTQATGTIFWHIYKCAKILSHSYILFITIVLLLVARRATYVVDGRFFAHYFWKVEGTVRIHVNSRVAHVWLPYTVINVQAAEGGAIPNFVKLRKFGKLPIFIKVVESISDHIGSHE